MPKVTKIERAGKDYPKFGIKKGETHFVWSIKMQRGGIVLRSKTYPKQSQLTMSPYKKSAHELNERIAEFSSDSQTDIEDFRDEIVGEAENLRDEVQESLDNMPEGLQQGPTGETLQSRIDALENFISELEGLGISDFEPIEYDELEEPDEDSLLNDEGQTQSEYWETVIEELKSITLDVE